MDLRIDLRLGLLAPVCALLSAGCQRDAVTFPVPAALSGPTMGTWYHIKLAAYPDGLTEDDLQRDADERLHEINRQMSTYLADSELSRFNRYAGEDWFEVSPELATVVTEAQRVAADSGGAFDVTVGPLVNLWNFGPDPQPERIPSDEEIAVARQRVDHRQVEARLDPPALRKFRPDIYVDLSAIAKGFAVDAIAELLDERGVGDYMVEIGGEVRTKGAKLDGQPWRIGIERPVSTGRLLQRVVELGDDALATSGDYRNFFDWQGQKFSHEIDPRTGRPVNHSLASVSVIAEDCMTADALATALIVLGPDQALQYAENHDVEVLLILRRGEEFEEIATPGFVSRTQEP
jgi:thiamine biosynthesis lipoprotein